MDELEAIEDGLKTPCTFCTGTGTDSPVYGKSNMLYCVKCFGTGLNEYQNIPDDDRLLVQSLLHEARAKFDAGGKTPWKLSKK